MPADIEIRNMTGEEVGIAKEWAAQEGWNPGLHDAASFFAADPDGFFIALEDGRPAGSISCVAYDDAFCFAGLFIVREGSRGAGIGRELSDAALRYAGGRSIGLDAVVEMESKYSELGFKPDYHAFRYRGTAVRPASIDPDIMGLPDVDPVRLIDYDALHFPARRQAFLEAWVGQPDGFGAAYTSGTRVLGYGFLRRCVVGYRYGPVFARDRGVAEALIDALGARVAGSPVFLDVPSPNRAGVSLAVDRGMEPVFETVRMYNGRFPRLPLKEVFGVTSFELG